MYTTKMHGSQSEIFRKTVMGGTFLQ